MQSAGLSVCVELDLMIKKKQKKNIVVICVRVSSIYITYNTLRLLINKSSDATKI